MRRRALALPLCLALAIALTPAAAGARGERGVHRAHASAPVRPSGAKAPHGVHRHRGGARHEGHVRRSRGAREAFVRAHPCPSTGRRSGACPGYVVDHVVPLKRGGADAPENMQWQTVEQAKAKDRWE